MYVKWGWPISNPALYWHHQYVISPHILACFTEDIDGHGCLKQSIILYISEVRVSSKTEVGSLFIIIFFTKPWIGSHGYF